MPEWIKNDYTFQAQDGSYEEFRSDPEWSDNGSMYDYGFRIYNSRIAKFLSVDSLFQTYPYLTTYQFADNDPIRNIDIDGLEGGSVVKKSEESFVSKVARGNSNFWGRVAKLWGKGWHIPPPDAGMSQQSDVTDANTQSADSNPNATAPEVSKDDSKPVLKVSKSEHTEDKNGSIKLEMGEKGAIKGTNVKQIPVKEVIHKNRSGTDAIILHRTAGSSAESAINWWKNPESEGRGTVFIIAKDGRIIQTAPIETKTWHVVPVKGRVDGNRIWNSYTIGIEIVGEHHKDTDSWDSLTEKQKESLIALTKFLIDKYDLSKDDIYNHKEINDHKETGEGRKQKN